jgi:hypothetical protein
MELTKERLEQLRRAEAGLKEQRALLQQIWREETEIFRAEPEQWRESDDGKKAGETLDTLSDIISEIEGTLETLMLMAGA